MYSRPGYSHCVCALGLVLLSGRSTVVLAQSSPSAVSASAQQAPSGASAQGHMEHDSQMAREASGTAWLPDATPMYAFHWQRGSWQYMAHENAFLQSLHESSERGDDQAGSINWIMGMAQRNVGRGRLMLSAMFSAEPWTIGGCGYPDLLASGEQCRNETIHDRQHPHDLFMELTAEYDAPLKGAVRLQLYGGPVGEPALGPVAFPHRISAMPNPLAPIAHHWLDSTHVSFGVITAGLFGNKWKAEASVFNGREPDEIRTNFDFGALDSLSGRLWFLPTPNIALQVSAGRLNEAEAAEGAGPRSNVNRLTASATYHRIRERSVWASTIAWGRNSELGDGTTAVLMESSFTVADRDAWFGRWEVAGKTPHDLELTTASESTLTLTKVQGGYVRYLPAVRGFKVGFGAEGSVGVVPAELRSVYGSRANVGAGIFVTVRPAMMTSSSMSHQGAGDTMVMVQTAFDPAKLSCSPAIDPKTASSTVYEGKTYYFCSEQERAEFMKDPKGSLSMMPPKQ
jgi:YHS domain-containing protein